MPRSILPLIPPEWAPQKAIWLGWPHLEEAWAEDFVGAQGEIAALVTALAPRIQVKIVIGHQASRQAAQALIGPNVALFDLPMGDIWLRDTGPIIVPGPQGLSGLCFVFNGWGGKYDLPGDQETAGAICAAEGAEVRPHDFVLEGGAVEQDGAGRLITTRQCLLNPNRNPGWTEARATQILQDTFAVEQVIWLGDGLLGDHTDGHVDNLARFIGPGHVVCQRPSGASDPHAEILAQVEADLRASGLRVDTIPSPGLILNSEGEPAPASHMNFILCNGALLLPIYEPTHSQAAAAALTKPLPGYEIIPLPARHILSGGGAFHCMSQHVPA